MDTDSAETHASACGGVNFTIVTDPDQFNTTTTTGTDCVTLAVNEYNLETSVGISTGIQNIFLTRAPVELFADDFNRADSPNLGANYTTITSISGPHSIVSNQADHNTLGGQNGEARNTPAAPNDQYGEVTFLITPVATSFAYLMLRSDPATFNGYGFGFDMQNFGNARARIVTIIGGVITTLAVHASQTIAPGDIIKAQVIGTSLRLFINGTQFVFASDATFATGQWGLDSLSLIDTPAFDNLSGGVP